MQRRSFMKIIPGLAGLLALAGQAWQPTEPPAMAPVPGGPGSLLDHATVPGSSSADLFTFVSYKEMKAYWIGRNLMDMGYGIDKPLLQRVLNNLPDTTMAPPDAVLRVKPQAWDRCVCGHVEARAALGEAS